MNSYKTYLHVTLSLCFMLCALWVGKASAAEQKAGPYTVHYNAFNSTFIKADVAKQTGLPRNSKTGLINIAVQNTQGKLPVPLQATFKGRVENLLGQAQQLEFTLIKETGAIYYLAPFTFENEDKLRFFIDVTPESAKGSISIKFHQTFYQD